MELWSRGVVELYIGGFMELLNCIVMKLYSDGVVVLYMCEVVELWSC